MWGAPYRAHRETGINASYARTAIHTTVSTFDDPRDVF